ncbi:MAG: hypothetical protein ACE5J1_04550 [Nitrospiria bacterium]
MVSLNGLKKSKIGAMLLLSMIGLLILLPFAPMDAGAQEKKEEAAATAAEGAEGEEGPEKAKDVQYRERTSSGSSPVPLRRN